MRAIILAPQARNLATEFGGLALFKFRGGTNGLMQAWDTDSAGELLMLPVSERHGWQFFTALGHVPMPFRRHLIKVLVTQDPNVNLPREWKTLSQCTTSDYFSAIRKDTGEVVSRQALYGGLRAVYSPLAESLFDFLPVHTFGGPQISLGSYRGILRQGWIEKELHGLVTE